MKKRLLAMLLAVVTTITSLPTPVYAAADDAVVDYVDEETDADALEVVVPDDADAVEVTEAPAEEAVVTEETTEAAPAAEEAVETPATEDVAAPAEENVTEEAGEADKNLPDVTEQEAVTIWNNNNNHNYWPKAPSLYGNTNFRFTEGEWDYNGGILNDNVILIARNADNSIYDFNEWDEVLDVNGNVAYDYKFSLAEGWNKDNLPGMSYTEIKPGSIVTVGGLQVSANETWLRDPATSTSHTAKIQREKIYLFKDVDYRIDDDKVVWIFDSYGVERKLVYKARTFIENKDGINYYVNRYEWEGFKDGVWDDDYKVYRRSTEVAGEKTEIGDFYVFDTKHDIPYYDPENPDTHLTTVSTNALSVVSVNKAGVYTLKAEVSYTVSRNALDNSGDREIVKVTDVGYATIFVKIADDVNGGWGKISYELGGKKDVRPVDDYSKMGGLEPKASYRVEWDVESGEPANKVYAADDKGEFKSDKYWAPNSWGVYLVKLSNAEANGNCDSNGKYLPLDATGASFFETPVIVEKTAPGLYGDKDQNNYNAAEKESIKISGIYGDNKFLYMKSANVWGAADMPAAGDTYDTTGITNGIAYKADAAKGTLDIYPQEAGINNLNAFVQYATTDSWDGVKYSGAAITVDNTPVYMIVKEAAPQGKIVGIQNEEALDEEGNALKDDTNKTVYTDYLKVSGLEVGKYRLRSTSDNHIYKGALYNTNADGEAWSSATGEYVVTKDIFGQWHTDQNEINYILINTFVVKEDSVIIEKINGDNEALNATQTIAISAEEIYVDIVPPLAGHKQVTTADVEEGVQPSMTDLNYNLHWRFNDGHKNNPDGRDFFYSVTDVKWNEAPGADGTFEKDKVYSATVSLTISSNEAISSNVAFKKDLTADNIHINDAIMIGTDIGNKNITVPAANISDIKVDGKNLTFKVTFEKAFIQYNVHRISVYDRVNGRTVTDLAEPVIYVAPGKEITIRVDAVNRFGNIPSLPSISYNGTLSNAKILWDKFFYPMSNGNGTLEDEENNTVYNFSTNDNGETFDVNWNMTVAPYTSGTDNDLTYDEFVAKYVNKYKMTAWNPVGGSSTKSVEFVISANVAASGEDKIVFTAENGLVLSKEIAIRYYAAAETPKDLTIEYGYVLKIGDGANAFERIFDVIHGLNPNTWYIIKTRRATYNLYSDDKGDIYVEQKDNAEGSVISGWYMDKNDYRPITIQVAYSESSKKAISDPYYLYVKRPYVEEDIYTRLVAPEVGNFVSNNIELRDGYYSWADFSVSNNIVWKDKDGATVAVGTPFGEKDSTYTVSFSVRMEKVKINENNAVVWGYDEGELPYSNVKLSSEHFFVPGAVSFNIAAKEGTDNVYDVSVTLKTADAGKVPVGLAFINAENNSYEVDGGNYNRSANGTWYAVSEGWGAAEGEVYLDKYFYFPSNAADPVGVLYTDSNDNAKVSVSMNDANGNKTRAQVSGNKVGDALLSAVVTNADGSKTELKAEVSDVANVYVKLAAPYNANNTDDTNYISGLDADAYYYAYSTYYLDDNKDDLEPEDVTSVNSKWYRSNVYQGKAYGSWGPNKNVTGFKRLSTWTDKRCNDWDSDADDWVLGALHGSRNTLKIKRTMELDGESKYDSAYVEIPLCNRIAKKGFYVTWPYGATDAPTSYTYNGEKIQPDVWVWYDGELLDNTNFYKVVYKNNVNVTTKKKATIQVVGKNGLKGKSNVVEFEITPRDINNATTYSADSIKKMVTVKKGTKLAKLKVDLYDFNQFTKTLKAKKDYKLSSTTTVFNADGWLLVEGQGNYTGTMLLKVITVDKFAKLTINMTNKGKVEYNYYRDGIWNVLPAMNVTVGGKNGTKLTEGLDFTIRVEQNTKANGAGVHNVGTYKLYVMGNGVYGGKFVKKTFKITPKKLTNVEANVDEIAAWAAGYQYDGIMGATLDKGLREGGKNAPQLKVVADNISLGYSYNSKKYQKFDTYGILKNYGKIVGYDLMDNGRTYKYTDSVSVTYKKNKKLGTASYTIKFGGNFKGTKAIKGTFKISETLLDDWPNAYVNYDGAFNGDAENVQTIIIPDVAYTGKAGTYFSNPFVYYRNGSDVNGFTRAKQLLYKKNRDYTVKYYKDATYKDEITNKNKITLAPGQEYATVYVKIEGKGGYGLTVDGKAGSIGNPTSPVTYRVYDPKKVQGGCVDLKSMKYYNGEAKPVKVKIQYTPTAYVVTSGSGKKLATITNDMALDGYNFTWVRRSSTKQPNWQVSMYGDMRIGRVVGYKNMKVTVKGELEKEWFR